MDIINSLVVSLPSGLLGALILHLLTVRESKKACKKAILKELEFGIHKAITTVFSFRNPNPRISFKGIELQIYPNAIAKHPDLFGEKQTLAIMFLYNSFKTFNENSFEPISPNYPNLVTLLWEDVIRFFQFAPNDIIPTSFKKYKNDIATSTIKDSPPELPGLFDL